MVASRLLGPQERRKAPSQPTRWLRRRCTIHSSTSRSQHDPATLEIAVDPQRDSVRVTPAGELDVSNAGALQAELDELHAAGFRHIVLDLRELTFMDSSAVRLILEEDRLARSSGRRFSLIDGSAAVRRVLSVCGLSEQLELAEPPTPSPRMRRAPAEPADAGRPSRRIAVRT